MFGRLEIATPRIHRSSPKKNRARASAITSNQIPDALVVDQLEGCNTRVGIEAAILLVIEGNVLPADDGLFQTAEGSFFAGQVLVILALHHHRCLDAGIEDVAQEVIRQGRKKTTDAS